MRGLRKHIKHAGSLGLETGASPSCCTTGRAGWARKSTSRVTLGWLKADSCGRQQKYDKQAGMFAGWRVTACRTSGQPDTFVYEAFLSSQTQAPGYGLREIRAPLGRHCDYDTK